MKRILICGYGSIGERHARVVGGLLPDAEITFCTKRETTEFPTIRDLKMADLSVFDFFIISSETAKHLDQLQIIDSRVSGKTILVEKPLFHRHVAFRPKNGVYVGYNMRFNPMIQKLRTLIEGKNIQSIDIAAGQYLPEWRPTRDYRKTYSASAELGGGVLLDLSHEVDYMNWLFGPIQPLFAEESKDKKLKIDSDEEVELVGKTKTGATLNCTLSYLFQPAKRKITVQHDSGTITADLIAFEIQKSENGKTETISAPRVERDYSYIEMHKDLLNGKKTVCTYAEAARIMEQIDEYKRLMK